MVKRKRWSISTSGHRTSLAVLLMCVCAAAGSEQERREQSAHEHGHGSLDVVADGDELAIQLRIPAMNVVGFEHEPSTDAQRQTVEAAIAAFRKAEKLFTPSEAANCRVEKVAVSLAGLEHHDSEKHSSHDSDTEKHDEETHSELHAEYHFRCEAPEQLIRLTVNVFDYLDQAEELTARVVTPVSQSAKELRPGETVLMLGGS